jgi:hypothetical protein
MVKSSEMFYANSYEKKNLDEKCNIFKIMYYFVLNSS